ncbi:MAG: hypothetical protein WC735_02475 [Candidatus Paceibacterota bacterium]|jgi:Tfp pilus assembly protein PilX
MMIKNLQSNRGFVMLFAVTLSAILLTIAIGVANIAFREVKFSTNARDTNDAFFAADTGAEYALYNYDSLSPDSFTTIPDIVGLGSLGQSCAIVTVDKRISNDPDNDVIISKGYNNCNSKSVQRELQVKIPR